MAVVTADPAEARAGLARGDRVVLIVGPEGLPSALPARPGRLALMVGDPAEPEVRAAARAMEAELRYEMD